MNNFILSQILFAGEIRKERESNPGNNSQEELRKRLFESRDQVKKEQDAIAEIDERTKKTARRKGYIYYY